MFQLNEKLFIALLIFSRSLATKCMSLNNEQVEHSTCICENSKYLKGFVDDSVTLCDERHVWCINKCDKHYINKS